MNKSASRSLLAVVSLIVAALSLNAAVRAEEPASATAPRSGAASGERVEHQASTPGASNAGGGLGASRPTRGAGIVDGSPGRASRRREGAPPAAEEGERRSLDLGRFWPPVF